MITTLTGSRTVGLTRRSNSFEGSDSVFTAFLPGLGLPGFSAQFLI
jgi:hypothetical protein